LQVWNWWIAGGFLVCGQASEEFHHGEMAAIDRIGDDGQRDSKLDSSVALAN
jgi:hypothetical protein